MALSNTERQKRWLEKNRALHNFRRRQKAKGGDASCGQTQETISPHSTILNTGSASNAELTVRPAGSATLQALRELITKESERPVETPVAVPTVFKDDYGRLISESQWKRLQKLKQKAKDGGWEPDEYSQ